MKIKIQTALQTIRWLAELESGTYIVKVPEIPWEDINVKKIKVQKGTGEQAK